MKHEIILASASPRRRKILDELGLCFSVVVADVCEVHLDCDPVATVSENAELKCSWVRERYADALVIAADTVVCFEGGNIGKPQTLDAAKDMLRSFSGKAQEVFSGVAIMAPGHKVDIFVEKSVVRFKELTDAVIDEYLGLVNPLDKAGGYDIDQHSELIIAGYTGSWTNIMGLPKEIVENWMRNNA